MNTELLDLAQWSMKTAKSAGADECRVSIQSGRSVEISYRERKPENIKEASTRGLSIRSLRAAGTRLKARRTFARTP
jgi:predicted Zn-dependent protease